MWLKSSENIDFYSLAHIIQTVSWEVLLAAWLNHLVIGIMIKIKVQDNIIGVEVFQGCPGS